MAGLTQAKSVQYKRRFTPGDCMMMTPDRGIASAESNLAAKKSGDVPCVGSGTVFAWHDTGVWTLLVSSLAVGYCEPCWMVLDLHHRRVDRIKLIVLQVITSFHWIVTGTMAFHVQWKFGAWISDYIHSFQWDVITHPCSNFNGGLAKPPLKLGHGWVITSHRNYCVWLLIHFQSHPRDEEVDINTTPFWGHHRALFRVPYLTTLFVSVCSYL